MVKKNKLPFVFQFNSPKNLGNTTETIGKTEFPVQYTPRRCYDIDERKDSNDLYPYINILNGIQEHSLFSKLFFSRLNIEEIQTRARNEVYLKSNKEFKIGDQNEKELITIMKAMYLQYGRVPSDIKNYKSQISKINNIVIQEIVPRIMSDIRQYINYIHDSTKTHSVSDRPVFSSSKGTAENRSVMDVMYGDDQFFRS